MVFLIGRRGMQGQLESSSEIGTVAPCSLQGAEDFDVVDRDINALDGRSRAT